MIVPAIKEINNEIKTCVFSLMTARAFSVTMRRAVAKVHRKILLETPIYANQFDETKQIVSSKNLYLTDDDTACNNFYVESDIILKNAGIKPDDMGVEFCPALVAERLVTLNENLLIEACVPVFRVSREQLYKIDLRNKFINLVCKLVISLKR